MEGPPPPPPTTSARTLTTRNSSPCDEYPLRDANFGKKTKNHNRLATVAETLEYFQEIVLECFIGNLKFYAKHLGLRAEIPRERCPKCLLRLQGILLEKVFSRTIA